MKQACGSPLRGLSGAGNVLGPDRVDVCSLSLAKKMQRLRNEREALCAKIRDVRSEEHISRQVSDIICSPAHSRYRPCSIYTISETDNAIYEPN